VYNPEYNQDFFLGVPYAQPPLGDLRFRIPQSINATFDGGVYSATKFSDECVGVRMKSLDKVFTSTDPAKQYGSDQWPYQVSEDCLYVSVLPLQSIELSFVEIIELTSLAEHHPAGQLFCLLRALACRLLDSRRWLDHGRWCRPTCKEKMNAEDKEKRY